MRPRDLAPQQPAGWAAAIAGTGGYKCSQPQILGLYAAVLLLLGLVNTFSVKLLDWINQTSVW